MARGVRLYLVGSVVLVSLAGCGRGLFQAEREPWRAESRSRLPEIGRGQEKVPSWSASSRFRAPVSAGRNFRSRSQRSARGNSSFGFADGSLAAARRYLGVSRAGRCRARRRPRRRPRSHPHFQPPYANSAAGLRRPAERADFADRARALPAAGRNRSAGGAQADEPPGRSPYPGLPAYPQRERYSRPPRHPRPIRR